MWCECDKLYDVGEYLDYKNRKFRKKSVGKLVEECTENAEGSKNCWNGFIWAWKWV